MPDPIKMNFWRLLYMLQTRRLPSHPANSIKSIQTLNYQYSENFI